MAEEIICTVRIVKTVPDLDKAQNLLDEVIIATKAILDKTVSSSATTRIVKTPT